LPRLQTFDGPELDGVLARVRKEAGPDAKIVKAAKVRSGGLGGFFSKEVFRVTVELTDAPAAPPEEEAPLVPPPASILELADLVDEAEAEAVAFVPTVRPPAPTLSTETPSFNAVLRRLSAEAGAPLPDFVATHLSEPGPETGTRTAGFGTEFVAPPVVRRELPSASRELLALGVPESMLPTDLSPGTAVAALLRSLQLPAVPPLPYQPGALTVVVGERRAAARLAADVAAELHLTKRDIVMAEDGPERPGRLVSPADALAERRTWTAGPTVLALTAPMGSRDLRWATDMLDALEPTAVWGVVDADRKVEDVEAWAEAIGGLDAVAVERLDATVSPASILRLGIPVARVEGQVATPALWAVTLAERLAA
jgi:hypothetical protein